MGTKLFSIWWLLLIAGILFILLGLFYIMSPGIALLSTGVFLGIILLASGISATMFAISYSGTEGWGGKLVEGLIDIFLGVIILWNPLASAMLIPIAIAIWAIVRGVILFVDSFSHKKTGVKDWWGFLILGLISIFFGFLMLGNLQAAAIVIGWIIGVILLAEGISAVYYAIRLKSV